MTILIRNGLVYDGSGEPPQKQDVFVRGKRITRLGNLSKINADINIDANGAMVTPGFIDINSTSDHYLSLFYEPYQEDFVRQGVTTAIGGNCGVSLAPLMDGSLASIDTWGNPSRININWRSVKEFLSLLAKRGLGVNFGTLAGYETVRRAITKDELRDLTDSEIEAFKEILKRAFNEGAFGLSTVFEPYSLKENLLPRNQGIG